MVISLLIPYCLEALCPSLGLYSWYLNYYLVIISLLLQRIINTTESLISQVNLITYIFHFQWLTGLANYLICNQLLPYYFLNIEHSIMIWLIFIIFYQLGILFYKSFQRKVTSAHISGPDYGLDHKILIIFSIVFFLLSFLGLALSLRYFGTLPLLMGEELDVTRFQWQKDMGAFITGRLVYSYLPMGFFLTSWFFLRGKVRNAIILNLLLVPIALFFGDRVPVVFLFTYLLLYFYKYDVILTEKKNIILIGATLILLITIFSIIGYIRGSLYGDEVASSSGFWQIGLLNFGTGVRDFTRFLESDVIRLVEIKDFFRQFLLVVPSFILTMAQFNLDAILDNSLPNMASNAMSHYSGIRFGIIGELFIYFGYFGIIWIFFIGLIVSKLENYWNNLSPGDPWFIVLSSMMIIVVFLPEEGPAIFISYLKLVAWATLPLLLFRRPIVQQTRVAGLKPMVGFIGKFRQVTQKENLKRGI